MPTKSPYETALNLAQEKLAALDLEDVAFNSSASLLGEKLTVTFLGEQFLVDGQSRQIIRLGDNSDSKIACLPAGTAEKIIILHYLITADGLPLTRKLITFENLTGASFYYPTYKARTIDILLAAFGNDLKRFLEVCLRLGVKTESNPNQGKASFLVLPNVPVNLIYWSGEKDIPPDLQILYDANITHYLPLEDIVVITELLTHKIIRLSKLDTADSSALYDYH